MKKHFIYLFSALTILMGTGCMGDFLDRRPSDSIDEEELMSTVDGNEMVLNGVFRYMYMMSGSSHDHFGEMSVNLAMDLRTDDIALHGLGHNWFAADYMIENSRSELQSRPAQIWGYYYHIIYQVNQILKYIDAATGDDELRDEVKGQALALRGYAHHRLVQIFQHTYVGHENEPGIPIRLIPTFESIVRAKVGEVYEQIVEDLTDAIVLLKDKPQYHPSHISYAGANGILARVYSVMNDWEMAEEYASEAIKVAETSGKFLMVGEMLQFGFNSAGNSEVIWGLAINGQQSTMYASFFSHMDPFAGGYATMGQQKKVAASLRNKISIYDWRGTVITDNDVDLDENGNFVWPRLGSQKFRLRDYNAWEGDYLLMRLAEMYLIRAEANARLGNDSRANRDLNDLLSTRIGDYRDQNLSGQQLIDEILLQRRIELWGEGFRYFDMKRNGEALNRDNTHQPGMALVMNMPALDNRWVMQIPQTELDANDLINSGDQNPL